MRNSYSSDSFHLSACNTNCGCEQDQISIFHTPAAGLCMCGVVWCGVVWCGLQMPESTYISQTALGQLALQAMSTQYRSHSRQPRQHSAVCSARDGAARWDYPLKPARIQELAEVRSASLQSRCLNYHHCMHGRCPWRGGLQCLPSVSSTYPFAFNVVCPPR